MVKSRSAESRYLVSAAKVLGCLRTGKLTVILFQGVGFVNGGLVIDISIALVPLDLRMPNNQFDRDIYLEECWYSLANYTYIF